MSEREATRIIVAQTVLNRISGRDISEEEIALFEPTTSPKEGERIIGSLNSDFKKFYASLQKERVNIEDRLYSMSEADQNNLDEVQMDMGGVIYTHFQFIMGVRGFFSEAFPVDESRPFQIRKGWLVVCVF